MRLTNLDKRSRNVSRVALIALAAASFAGCSSDVGRFEEPVYTGSTPNQRAILGSNGYAGGPASSASSYQGQPSWNRRADNAWQNVDTTGSIGTADAGVTREELAPPGPQYAQSVARPARPTLSDAGAPAAPARGGAGSWTGAGGTWVTLQPGENVDTLSRRYSVPSTAIRSVNNYGGQGGPLPGERVLIPVYNAAAPQAAAPAPVVRQAAPQPQTLRAPVATNHAPIQSTAPRPQAPQQVAARPAPTAPQGQINQTPPRVLTTGSLPKKPDQGGVKLVGEYTVKPGDSLASIARTYGCTEQALRERNNMRTGAVQPGQRLLLPAGTKLMLKTSENKAGTPPATAKVPTAPTQVAAAPAKPAQVAAAPVAPAKPATPAAPKDTRAIDQRAAETIAVAKEPTPEETTGSVTPGTFRWPVRGRVISEFGAKPNGEKNDGINLAVPEGTSIKAADEGEVIYVGNEIKGYGNLVLIAHPNGYTSAYAHASEILVKRGDKVSRGHIIARAGATGGVSGPQLHFELRRGRTPVDPKPHLASN